MDKLYVFIILHSAFGFRMSAEASLPLLRLDTMRRNFPAPLPMDFQSSPQHLSELLGSGKSTVCAVKASSASGNSLMVPWLGLGAFTAVGPGSIPGQGTKIPQAMR